MTTNLLSSPKSNKSKKVPYATGEFLLENLFCDKCKNFVICSNWDKHYFLEFSSKKFVNKYLNFECKCKKRYTLCLSTVEELGTKTLLLFISELKNSIPNIAELLEDENLRKKFI